MGKHVKNCKLFLGAKVGHVEIQLGGPRTIIKNIYSNKKKGTCFGMEWINMEYIYVCVCVCVWKYLKERAQEYYLANFGSLTFLEVVPSDTTRLYFHPLFNLLKMIVNYILKLVFQFFEKMVMGLKMPPKMMGGLVSFLIYVFTMLAYMKFKSYPFYVLIHKM
jgi:hypothetical protein